MTHTRVLFLCLGNICRSPLAEGVFRAHVEALGRAGEFEIDSAGTSAYHVGEPPDPGSVAAARAHGIDISGQRSRAITVDDLRTFDFIIPMDASNQQNLARVGKVDAERTPLLREFDPEALYEFDVPDPWGGRANGFETVYAILDRSMPALLEHIDHVVRQR